MQTLSDKLSRDNDEFLFFYLQFRLVSLRIRAELSASSARGSLEEGKKFTIGAWRKPRSGEVNRGVGGGGRDREKEGNTKKGGFRCVGQLITAFSRFPLSNCRYRESSDCHLTIHIT